MRESDDGGVDQYDTLLQTMREGLLIAINNSAPSATATGELRVENSRTDETDVICLEESRETYYRIHRDRQGQLVYGTVGESGTRYEGDVVTLEVIGLDD